MRKNPSLLVGIIISSMVFLICIAGHLVDVEKATFVYQEDGVAGQYVPPSLKHPLGLDRNGRDIALRIICGTRAFAMPGILAVCLGLSLGTLFGAISYLSGLFPTVIRFVLSSLDAIPRIPLILLFSLGFGHSIWGVAIGVAVSLCPTIAEEVSARVAMFKNEEFISASIAHGLSSTRILFFHILWLNSRHILLKWAAILFGMMILVETSLSYLGTIEGSVGIGVQEPMPSWGNILARAKDTLMKEVFPALYPILMTVISIVGFLLLAEGFGKLDLRNLKKKVEG